MQSKALLSPRTGRTVADSRLGDETLAGRAAGGDNDAFTALYERYYGPLLSYCRSILLDAEDARDATQSALENALRALPRREPNRPLKPWLYRIAHNEAINIVRRRQPRVEPDADAALTVPGPEADAEIRGRLSQLVSDLRALPERQRGALVMRELSGLTYDEIGAALGITNEAARRAVFDARSALHDAADGRATECVSIRHKLSDGDRRSLRARSVRAHLRSCDDCASFQRSITARRADLHVIGWLPGATGLSLLGNIGVAGGAGGAGGAALIAAGGGSVVAGVGSGWASLPVAVKGLAVAAAVATSAGAATVEIRQITKDSNRTAKAQVAEPSAAASASPHAAVASAVSAKRAPAAPSRVPSAHVQSRPSSHHETPVSKRATVAPLATTAPASSSAAPQTKAAPRPVAHRVATKTPGQIAIDKLTSLREQIRRAYAKAQTTAAAGTPAAVQTASTTLQQTLDALRPTLGSVGLQTPPGSAVPAVPASDPTQTNILAPVQQVLGEVSALLQNLLSRPSG